MEKIKHFILPEHTNELYKNEAISSISLTKEVANKINELVEAYNNLSETDITWKQTQEGAIRKGILFMKDNLMNSLHDLLEVAGNQLIQSTVIKQTQELSARLENLLESIQDGSITTMDAEVIDGRVAYNLDSYVSIGEAIRTQIRELHSIIITIFQHFELGEQYIKRADLESGRYYTILTYEDNGTTEQHVGGSLDPDSLALKDPVFLKAGITYHYHNLYPYFCIIGDFNGNAIQRLSSNTNTIVSGTYTPDVDCFIYITVNRTATNPMFTNAALPETYVEGLYSNILNGVKDAIGLNKQLLLSNNIVEGKYYYLFGGTTLDVGDSTSAFNYKYPIYLNKDVEYHYQGLYGYFCIITKPDGSGARRLSDDQNQVSVSGSYTPTEDELMYVTVNTTVDDAMLCDGLLPNSYVESYYSAKLERSKTSITVHVGADEEFASLLEGILYATKFMDSTVIVKSGTYNLINEFEDYYGVDFFTNYNSNSVKGIVLKNRVKVYFSGSARVDFKYTGSNQYVQSMFSPFNAGEYGFELHNLNIEAKNCRYCVHDERATNYDSYRNVYNNCTFLLDNSANTNWASKQCIGGGLGFAGNIEITNCIFDSVGGIADNGGVSYHNTSLSGAKSNIVISGCYFMGTNSIRISQYGKSTKITNVLITNNSLGAAIVKRAEDSTATVDNMNVLQFNNVVR